MKLFYSIIIFLGLGLGSLFAQDMTLQELSKYNGKNAETSKKAYIAVDKVIYDVSNNPQWKDGMHLPTANNPKSNGGPLMAGVDATARIAYAPHKKTVLEKLPKVGKLID